MVDLLGIPGGDWLQSGAHSVSERNDTTGAVFVAGNSNTAVPEAPEFHTVRWTVDTVSGSQTLCDLEEPPLWMWANVNDAGVVVTNAGCVYVPGLEVQELNATAFAVNSVGQIVGGFSLADGTSCGALWQLDAAGVPGPPKELGDFFPHDISDDGLMAGETGGGRAAIAWFDADGQLVVSELGVLPGYSWSGASVISANGAWVAGSCRTNGPCEAFRYSVETREMIGLGYLGGSQGSSASGVNDSGQVVGTTSTKRCTQAAFLYRDGKMFDLNTLADIGRNMYLGTAEGINNAGDIAGALGFGHPIDEMHGFLLISKGQ